MSMLRVENLIVSFQTRSSMIPVLKNISFSLGRGEAIGLWGHSGCGKTTVIRSILGVLPSEPGWVHGEAFFENRRVSPRVEDYVIASSNGRILKRGVSFNTEHRRLISDLVGTSWRAVFQDPVNSFESGRSVEAQVSGAIRRLSRGDHDSSKSLLEDFESTLSGLGIMWRHIRRKSSAEMSGGECQRLALALALMGKPKLLLADEPTTAIDARRRFEAHEAIVSHMTRSNMSLLISSHNREEMLSLATHVVAIYRGEILESMNREHMTNFSRNRCHPYTRKLWFSLGDMDQVQHEGKTLPSHERSAGCPYYQDCHDRLDMGPEFARRCLKQRPLSTEIESGHLISCWLFESTPG